MKKSTDHSLTDLDEVQKRKAALEAEIARQKSLPEQLRLEEEERKLTLPPSDLVENVVRTREFEKKVSIGEINNTRREFARSASMTVLLLIAAAVVLWWFVQAIDRYGWF